MEEKIFKDYYIATFLATFAANRFKRDFFEGNISDLYKNQPVAEAIKIADHAWRNLQKARKENK